MKKIQKKNRIPGFIFVILAVWIMIVPQISYGAQQGGIRIKTEQAGMTIHLYRIAEKQNGTYVMKDPYASSGADVTGGGSRDAALLLAAYVKEQKVPADRTKTGSGSEIVFWDLPGAPGGQTLWLITGESVRIGKKTYTPVPVLVEAGKGVVEVDLKCDIDDPTSPTEPTKPTDPAKPTNPTKSSDPDNPTKPSHHHDGSDDDWDPTPDKKPRPTKATGKTAAITETGTGKAEQESSAAETAAPAEAENKTSPAISGILPQTGLYWWPIEVFGILGVIFLTVGIVMERREKKK